MSIMRIKYLTQHINKTLRNSFLFGVLAILAVMTWSCKGQQSQDDSARRAELVAESKVLYREGDYNTALSTLHKFLQMERDASAAANKDDIINAYLMLGNIHLAFGDYVRAYSYYEDGLKASRQAGMPDNEMKFLNDLAIVSCYQGNRDNAMKFNEMVADLHPKDSVLRDYLHLITSAYIEKTFGSKHKALSQMRNALAYIDAVGMDKRMKLSSLSEMSEYFEETNQLDSALHYLGIYDTIASEEKATDMIADNKRRYMRVYTKLGDTENALKYQEEYFAHTDSAMNTRLFLSASNRFQQEQETRTGIQMEHLEKTVYNQQLIIAIIIFVICVTALWLFYKHKQRVGDIQLFRRNRELVEIEEKVRKMESMRKKPVATDASSDSVRDEVQASSENLDIPVAEDGRTHVLYEQIASYMATTEEYCDPEFSLGRLAKAVGSNTKYVSTAINEHTGKNFRTFINEFRIREARRRLLDTENYGNITIQYLAESVGFMSTSAFNMAFKKFTGMTPSLYQKMGKQC